MGEFRKDALFREFRRIKWAKPKVLFKHFAETLIFIVSFAMFFYVCTLIVSLLLKVGL